MVKEIAVNETAAVEQIPRPKPKRAHRGVIVIMAILLAVTGGTVAAPKPVEAYNWGAWHYRYYSAKPSECAAARYVIANFVGPIQTYTSSCIFRVQWRQALIDTWAGWDDRVVQLENSAPMWSGAWGMSLQVMVHSNGLVVRYSPESLICRTWGFMIQITQTDCMVFGDNTPQLTPRMAYTASFSYLFGSMSTTRGAQESIFNDGSSGGVFEWP